MFDEDTPVAKGRKGGKAGGSGGAPYEAPDNLLADSTAYVIDLVSEGEIEGWSDPDFPGKCIYFDDTPLQNADDSFNFEGVQYWLRTGTPDQEPVPGFSAVENEISVAVQVEEAQPITRTITDPDIDAARLKVGVASLSTMNTETGDVTEATVEFDIHMQAGAADWIKVGSYVITGKTTSGYQRAYRIELPPVRPVSLRVTRTTPDSEESSLQNDLYFVSLTEIIDAKLTYPDSAYVALAIPAAAFGGRIPRRSYRLKGMRCLVPSNYDPVTRTYDETTIWDGTFKRAFTSNPAFFSYTVWREDRWGLGSRIPAELTDKWAIYEIGKYCDGMVPDGNGGTEPRFTLNGVMNTREAAYDVVTKLSAAWRGVTYWGAGAVVPVQDAPSDPVKLVTNANVHGGEFSYSGTAQAARKTAVVAAFRHPADHYRMKAGLVFEDHDAIARFGRRQKDISLPFCASWGEAWRTARWEVDTALNSVEMVSYQAGFDHAGIRPGDVVLIQDKHRIGFRMGGRITDIAPDRQSVSLDAPVELLAGETYDLFLTTSLGEFITATVTTPAGADVTSIDVSAALPASIVPGAVFALSVTQSPPRHFRVMSNTPEGHLFNVTALQEDPDKHARVELDVPAQEDDPYFLPVVGVPAAPASLNLTPVRVVDPVSTSKLRLLVSWARGDDPLVSSYVVSLQEPGGTLRVVDTTQETSIEVFPRRAVSGTYKVQVAARTEAGIVSPAATAELAIPDEKPVVDEPYGLTYDSRFDEIGIHRVDWSVTLTSASPYLDTFELQKRVSLDPDVWEVVGQSAEGVFSIRDQHAVALRARCRNLFGVWSDWGAVGGGVVIAQAQQPQDFAFDNLGVEGSLRLGDGIRAYFGSDDDMAMFHDGFNGAIEVATGQLLLRGPSILGQLDNGAGGWTTIFGAGAGGAFNAYHNGDLKFNTTSVGATLSGRLTLFANSPTQDNTRIHLNRIEGPYYFWMGAPTWDPASFYFYMSNHSSGTEVAAKYANRTWTFYSEGVQAMTVASAKVTVHNAFKFPDYTVLTKPNPGASGVGAGIYISDTNIGPQLAVSNGTAWVGQVDGNIIT